MCCFRPSYPHAPRGLGADCGQGPWVAPVESPHLSPRPSPPRRGQDQVRGHHPQEHKLGMSVCVGMCVCGGGGGGGIPFKKQCKSFRKFEEEKRVPWPRLEPGNSCSVCEYNERIQSTDQICLCSNKAYIHMQFLGLMSTIWCSRKPKG